MGREEMKVTTRKGWDGSKETIFENISSICIEFDEDEIVGKNVAAIGVDLPSKDRIDSRSFYRIKSEWEDKK